MNETLLEAASLLENSSVRRWKNSGGRVIGYTCSYLPEEILHAAGILPYRMRGYGAESTVIGDTYFGPFICSHPKCLLQLAGEGRYNFLDGAIVTPGCDSMRRLDECWRKSGEDNSGTLPGFFHHFGVPHKVTDYSIRWFIGEIENLIRALENHFSVSISDDRLHGSIRLYNKSRELMSDFEELRSGETPRVSGSESLAVALAGSAIPREEYVMLLEERVKIAKTAVGITGKKRILLAGSASDDPALVDLIEGKRAMVVADTSCYGIRYGADMVDEDIPPREALARRYLERSLCPRMFGEYRRRLDEMREIIERRNIDGVIMQNIRFCDLHGTENGLLERDLEKIGIPAMRLEREYGPLVERNRIIMRLDAFFERIGKVS